MSEPPRVGGNGGYCAIDGQSTVQRATESTPADGPVCLPQEESSADVDASLSPAYTCEVTPAPEANQSVVRPEVCFSEPVSRGASNSAPATTEGTPAPPRRPSTGPTPAQRNAQAVAEGRRAYQEAAQDDHWINEAGRYWDDAMAQVDRDVAAGRTGPLAATARYTGARVMRFFVDMSGIAQVRNRAAQLGAEVGAGADGWEIAKTGAMLTGEVALSAANGLGVGGVSRSLAVRAEGALITRTAEAAQAARVAARGADDVARGATTATRSAAQGGDDVARAAAHSDDAARATGAARPAAGAIAGMRAVSREAAEQVTRELQQLVRDLPLGEGGRVTPAQAQQFLSRLQEVASRYGINLREGGVAGEAVGGARDLVVSLRAGAAHEMVHALQMVQVRAAAFADEAARLGTTIADMPAAAFDRAYQSVVRPFEHQAYATFESMAFQATGFMGRADAATYRAALTEGLQAFGEGLANAARPVLGEGLGARLYGELTILGRSQAEIADKLAVGTGAVINHQLHQQ